MESRREPYGYVGEEAPDLITLIPEEGRVELHDPGTAILVEDGMSFDEAYEAAAQQREEATSVILVVSGTAELTQRGSEPARYKPVRVFCGSEGSSGI